MELKTLFVRFFMLLLFTELHVLMLRAESAFCVTSSDSSYSPFVHREWWHVTLWELLKFWQRIDAWRNNRTSPLLFSLHSRRRTAKQGKAREEKLFSINNPKRTCIHITILNFVSRLFMNLWKNICTLKAFWKRTQNDTRDVKSFRNNSETFPALHLHFLQFCVFYI